jgi:hypothetical protein
VSNGDRCPVSVPSRGVSPVVGVILIVALVVLLALVLATLAFGIEMPSDPRPQCSYRTAYVADGEGNTNDRPFVNLTLSGGRVEVGEDLYIVQRQRRAVGRRVVHVGTADGR